MSKSRREKIIEVAKHEDSEGYFGFISGAEWADANPTDHNWQKLFFEGHDHNVCLKALRQMHIIQEQNEKLSEALKFYVEKYDYGETARAALKELGFE